MKTKLTLERPSIRVYIRKGKIYVGTNHRLTAPFKIGVSRWNYNFKNRQQWEQ